MSERDELIELIRGIDGPATLGGSDVADAVLAAGYRKPREVNTIEELEALPDLAVIFDKFGDVSQKRGDLWCGYESASLTSNRVSKYTPAVVLWDGVSL